MIQIRPEWYPLETNRKLHERSASPFKVLQQVGSNAYVIDLQLDFDISYTFNIKKLIVYWKPYLIPNDPFEMPLNPPPDDPIKTSTPFTLSSS